MEDARRSTRGHALPESVDDVLARHGLLGENHQPPAPPPGAPSGGRAARRRAAEERERAEAQENDPQPRPSEAAHRGPDPGSDGGVRRPADSGPGRAGTRDRTDRPDPTFPLTGAAPPGAVGPRNGPPGPPGGHGSYARSAPPSGGVPSTGHPPGRPAPFGAPPDPRPAPPEPDRRRHAASSPAPTGPAGEPTTTTAAARTGRHQSAAASSGSTQVPARPGRDDIGSGRPDVSEQAERTRREERTGQYDTRVRAIDETLTRFTAAHAGLALSRSDDDEPAEPSPAPAVRRRRPGLALRLAVLVVTVLVVVATTAGWAAQSWLDSSIVAVSALDAEGTGVVDAGAQDGDRNVLLVATDSGIVPGAAGAASAGTMVVAHVPAGGDGVAALSIPTDLEINRPPCDRYDPATATYTGETVPAEVRTSLRTAWELGGPRCTTRVVQQLTGIAITSYVGTDVERLGAAVDAVSGVAVCVPRPVIDGALGPVVPDAGENTLDGRRAADFVRAADVATDPAPDLSRVERQQQVVAGVLDSALSPGGLFDLTQLTALRSVFADAFVTDGAGLSEILAVALSLRRIDAPGVIAVAVPTTTGPNGRGQVELRDADAAAVFAAVREDTPLPAAASDPGSAGTGPSPADVTVEIVNASDRSGLAAEIGTTLGALGFGVGELGNTVQPTPQTVIRFSPDQAAAAELLATTVPSATPVPDPGATGVLQLVLGRSFDNVVRAPTEPVTPSAPASDVPPVEC